MKKIWSEEQVSKLNEYQNKGEFHSFTCDCGEVLMATVEGWRCPNCPGFHQDWAHSFMFGE